MPDEFKPRYFSADQIRKIDEGMKLLLQKGEELDKLKVYTKQLETQIKDWIDQFKTKSKQYDQLEAKFKEQVKTVEILETQIQTLKDEKEYEEVDDEEFATYYSYLFGKQEKK